MISFLNGAMDDTYQCLYNFLFVASPTDVQTCMFLQSVSESSLFLSFFSNCVSLLSLFHFLLSVTTLYRSTSKIKIISTNCSKI